MKKYILSFLSLFLIASTVLAVTKQFTTGNPSTTGLLSYWNMNSDFNDYYGTNNLSTTGTVTHQTGKIGNDADFGNTYSATNKLGIGSGFFDITNSSISLWLNIATEPTADDSNMGSARIIDWRDTTGTKSYVLFDYFLHSGTYTLAIGGINIAYTFNTGTWYNVTLTSNSGASTLYINGVNKGTGTLPTGISTNVFYLGNASDVGYLQFPGGIDEVSVWNTALSSTAVGQLYNADSGETMCTVGVDCPTAGGRRKIITVSYNFKPEHFTFA